jgi:hypothetical protein
MNDVHDVIFLFPVKPDQMRDPASSALYTDPQTVVSRDIFGRDDLSDFFASPFGDRDRMEIFKHGAGSVLRLKLFKFQTQFRLN